VPLFLLSAIADGFRLALVFLLLPAIQILDVKPSKQSSAAKALND
jgi:hypothetical protein